MDPNIQLTPKQAAYAVEAHHRWNFAVGAVRSGKSYMATLHTIPDRVISGRGRRGINLILGASKETIERNVLTPMRDLWGDRMVGEIDTRNRCELFGERAYCIGAEKVSQVSKLRGSEVKFCYVDEVCDVHPDVFEMLKSRLSLPWSECHCACNPAGPRHYVKQFIDLALEPGSGIDLFYQHYTIWDNPFLPPEYVSSLEAEYRGTVYYKRYIEGLWAQAEGLVYPMWEQAVADPPAEVAQQLAGADQGLEECVSVDYGTMNAFAALRWIRLGDTWWLSDEWRYSGRDSGRTLTDGDYADAMGAFCATVPDRVRREGVPVIVDPSAASFIAELRQRGGWRVRKADNDVADGIRDVALCLQSGRVRVSPRCEGTLKEFDAYSWDDRAGDDRPVKVEDHCMDAMRYMVRTRRLHRPQEAPYRPLLG